MIRNETLLPSVYTHESRDFQILERVFDIVLNDALYNVDLMRCNQDDPNVLQLRLRTLGFFPKGTYSNDDLMKLSTTFSEMMKYKGSLKAINILLETLLDPNETISEYSVTLEQKLIREEVDESGNVKEITLPCIVINIPNFVYDSKVALIEEVLEYIRPIGCLYEIQTSTIINSDVVYTLQSNSKVDVAIVDNNGLGHLAKTSTTYIKTTSETKDSGVVEQDIVQGDIRIEHLAKKESK